MRIGLGGSYPPKLVEHALSLRLPDGAESLEVEVLTRESIAEVDAPQRRDGVGDHRVAEVADKPRVDGVVNEEARGEVREAVQVVLMDGVKGRAELRDVERGDAEPADEEDMAASLETLRRMSVEANAKMSVLRRRAVGGGMAVCEVLMQTLASSEKTEATWRARV